jgi:syntaxin-binding protein 1
MVNPRIIGSTHITTPERFIDDLKVLEMEGVGSVALPNGLPLSGPASGEYQEYYDKRYFTPDAPPPAVSPPPPSGRGRYAEAKQSRPTNGGGDGGLRPSDYTPSPTPSQATLSSSGTKEKKRHRLFGF